MHIPQALSLDQNNVTLFLTGVKKQGWEQGRKNNRMKKQKGGKKEKKTGKNKGGKNTRGKRGLEGYLLPFLPERLAQGSSHFGSSLFKPVSACARQEGGIYFASW